MKQRLPLFIFMVITVFILVLNTGEAAENKTGVFSFSGSLPQFETFFDDLDARDENNQSINNPSVKRNLVELFNSGLYKLLVYSEIYSIAKAMEVLKVKLQLADFSLSKALPVFAGKIAEVIIQTKKIFWDIILACLYGFLAFKITTQNFAICILQFAILRCKTAPAVLRL